MPFLRSLLLIVLFAGNTYRLSPAPQPAAAQQPVNLVAHLRVDVLGVEVRRTNTDDWTPVVYETLVGVGDSIRTLQGGRATITFVASLLSLQMFSNSEIGINDFSGTSSKAFALTVDMRQGIIIHRGTRKLGDQIKYHIITPGFQAMVDVGDSDFRVEPNGRSGVFSVTGVLDVTGKDGTAEHVTATTGVRADAGGFLSDVVPAASFAQLDSQLDGCPSVAQFGGDVQLNIRTGAGTDYPIIGTMFNNTPIQAMGKTVGSGWIRIRYMNGFGWIKINGINLALSCAGLRVFPNHQGPETQTF